MPAFIIPDFMIACATITVLVNQRAIEKPAIDVYFVNDGQLSVL